MIVWNGFSQKESFNWFLSSYDLKWPLKRLFEQDTKKFKLSSATQELKLAYEQNQDFILSFHTVGKILLNLSNKLNLYVVVFNNSLALGDQNENIFALYPSETTHSILPLVHYTSVGKKKKISTFESWKINKYFAKVYKIESLYFIQTDSKVYNGIIFRILLKKWIRFRDQSFELILILFDLFRKVYYLNVAYTI